MTHSSSKLKFLKTVKERHYFDQHQKVLVALSGGIDSMTLFNWLYEFQETLAIELGIVHINHGLREASENEEKQIRKLGNDLAVPVYVARFTGEFTEQNARDFRYRFFQETMENNAYTALVTAHHKGDLVETVLMRQITGRPLRSLQGIKECQPFASCELIRPLLDFSKTDFDAPVFYEDQTNFGLDYFRNRVRNQLIPEMTEENPRFSEAIADLSSEIKKAMTVITDNIQSLGVISHTVDLILFLKQSPSLQHFILQEYLAKFSDIQMSKAQFADLLLILNRPQQYRSELNKNYIFVKNHENFYIEKKPKLLDEDWSNYLEILSKNPQDSSYFQIDLPQNGEIEIRRRRPHDVILINGNHKSLRKYFIEKHVSLEKRQNFLILVENNVYGIANLVCSDLSKALKNDKMRRTLWVKPILREEKVENA